MDGHKTAPYSLKIAPPVHEPLRNSLYNLPTVNKPYCGHNEAVKGKGNGQRADLCEVAQIFSLYRLSLFSLDALCFFLDTLVYNLLELFALSSCFVALISCLKHFSFGFISQSLGFFHAPLTFYELLLALLQELLAFQQLFVALVQRCDFLFLLRYPLLLFGYYQCQLLLL